MSFCAIERTFDKYAESDNKKLFIGNKTLTTELLKRFICQDKDKYPERFNPVSNKELSKLTAWHINQFEKARYHKVPFKKALVEIGEGIEITSIIISDHPCPELIMEVLKYEIPVYNVYHRYQGHLQYWRYPFTKLDNLGSFEQNRESLQVIFDSYFGLYFVHNVLVMNCKEISS